MDWTAVRAQFPAMAGQTYVNTASYGPPPDRVAKAVHDAVSEWHQGRVNFVHWETAGERARDSFAKLIGGHRDGVALVPTVSMAAGQVAERLDPARGSTIVVPDNEFRSNLYPWLVQERRGFSRRLVALSPGGDPADDLIAAIDDDTNLVAFSSVHSASGQRIDVARVATAARDRGARVFVDATQACGVWDHPLELIDYMGVGAYKWLMGPRGASFLYVRPELVDEMTPAFAGWRTPEARYSEFYGPPLDMAPRASRFDAGLAYLAWVGLAESLDFLAQFDRAQIRERDTELAERFCARLPELGLAPLFGSEQRSQIVSLAVPDPDAVRERLSSRGVVAAVRGPYLRVSFHLYNDSSDVDAVIDALGSTS
jgi:selenocysteine lyase/cysteine desulfurase